MFPISATRIDAPINPIPGTEVKIRSSLDLLDRTSNHFSDYENGFYLRTAIQLHLNQPLITGDHCMLCCMIEFLLPLQMRIISNMSPEERPISPIPGGLPNWN